MATNLQLDDKMIEKAVKLGGHRSKKAAVMEALSEYIHHKEQDQIIPMFGTIEYSVDYNYMKQRAKA